MDAKKTPVADQTKKTQPARGTDAPSSSRVPQNSILYSRVVPLALIFLALIALLLVLFGAGIVVGFIRF